MCLKGSQEPNNSIKMLGKGKGRLNKSLLLCPFARV